VFTGIIEAVGTLTSLEPRGEVVRVEVEAGRASGGVRIGDSVAVNGCCLTVTAIADERLAFEAVKETLEKTSLGDQREGARVNLERAMRADGRLDGHIVQGHVDGTGRVRVFERRGDDVRLEVACGPEIARYLVPKGSVAIDGVSLTVVSASDDAFDVALIPHTLAETNLGDRASGERVNLEADVLGKYVVRYLERTRPGGA
jgi:riboflavin synthase alpha subunit